MPSLYRSRSPYAPSTPQSDAATQEQMAVAQVNEEAKYQDLVQKDQEKQQRQQEQLASQQAKAAKAQMTAAKRAGAATEVDQTGVEQLKRHEDGGVMYNPGFIDTPKADDTGNPQVIYRDTRGARYQIPLDQIQRTTDPTGAPFNEFTVNGQRIRQPESTTKPLFKVNPATGERYSEALDPETGTTVQTALGLDPRAANKAQIELRKQQYEKKKQAAKFEADNLQMERQTAATNFEPLNEQFRTAKTAASKFTKGIRYEQRPEGLVTFDRIAGEEVARPLTTPQEIAKANSWLQQKKQADDALTTAKSAYDPEKQRLHALEVRHNELAAQALRDSQAHQTEIADMEEAGKAGISLKSPEWKQVLDIARKDPRYQQIMAAGEYADQGSDLAKAINNAILTHNKSSPNYVEAQKEPPLSIAQKVMRDLSANSPRTNYVEPDAPVDSKAVEARAERRSFTDSILQGITADKPQPDAKDAANARSIAAKSLNVADPDKWSVTPGSMGDFDLHHADSDTPVGRLDPDNKRILLFPDATADEAGKAMMSKAGQDGYPVYRMGGAQPMTPQELRDYIGTAINTARSAPTDAAKVEALKQAGVAPDDIRDKMMSGRISVQDAKWLNQKLYGAVEHDNSADGYEKGFQEYLSQNPAARNMLAKGTPEQKDAVISQYANQRAGQSQTDTTLDRDQLTLRRFELQKRYNPESKLKQAVDTVKGVFIPMGGMLAQAGAYVPMKVAQKMGYEADAIRLSDMQGVDWWNNFGSFVRKMNARPDVESRVDELRQWATRARPGEKPPQELADSLAKAVYDGYHAYTPEQAKDRETSADTFNVNKDPALAGALQNYLQTSDPAALKQLTELMVTDAKTRKTMAEVSKYVERPRVATADDVKGRAATLGANLKDGEAAALMGLAKSLEGAKDAKQSEAIMAQAAKILGTTTPEDTALVFQALTTQATTDPNSALGMWRSGFSAGPQEMATEVASSAIEAAIAAGTAGAATPEILAERAARTGVKAAASRMFRRAATRTLDAITEDSALLTAARGAIGRGRTKLGTALTKAEEDFAKAGIVTPKFGQPLTTGQKLRNVAVSAAKSGAAAAPVEGLEELAGSLGDNDPSIEGAVEQGAMGALGGFLVGPAFLPMAYAGNKLNARKANAAMAEYKQKWADEFNASMAQAPGFKPMTPADFDAWQGLANNPSQTKAAMDFAGALTAVNKARTAQAPNTPKTPELLAAEAQLDVAKQNLAGISQVTFDAADELRAIPEAERPLYTGAAKALTGAREFTEAEAKALISQSGANAVAFQQAEVLPADVQGPRNLKTLADLPEVTPVAPGIYRLPEGVQIDVPQPLLDTLAQAAPSMGQLMTRQAGVTQAAPAAGGSAPTTTPVTTPKASKKAKVANPPAQTAPTNATTAAANQPQQAPTDVVGQVNGKPLTRGEAIAALGKGVWQDEAGAVKVLKKQFGITDAEASAILKGTYQQASPPVAGNPTAKDFESFGQVTTEANGKVTVSTPDLGKFDALRAELKKRGIHITAAGSTGTSKGTTHSTSFNLPAQTSQPAKPAKPTKGTPTGVENLARRVIGEIAAKSKKLKSIITEAKKAPAYQTGGMWMRGDGTVAFHMPTLVEQLDGLDEKTAAQRVAALLDEEIRHAANMEAAKRLYAKMKRQNPMLAMHSFEEWRDLYYSDIWDNHFTDEMRAKVVVEAYGKTIPEQKWQKAMEGLRMYSQLEATGSITEAVLRHLEAVLEALREFIDAASPKVKAEIEAIKNVLQEFGYEGGGRINEAKAKKKVSKPKAKKAEAEKPADTPKSSTQLTLKPADAAPILAFGKSIPKDELFESVDPEWSNGALEDEPHVTVLYGLTKHEADPVAKLAADHGPITVTLGKMSIFSNDQYDVLKLDVESPELRSLNAKFSKLPNENSFPDYKPHLTIAYLKKGEGAKYVGDDRFAGKEITFDTVTFSPPKELREKPGRPELPLSPATTASENQTPTGSNTTDENTGQNEEGRQGQGRQEGLLNPPAATGAEGATPPAATTASKASIDKIKAAFDGLASAPAPSTVEQVGLPKDRRTAFLDVADSLITDGVKTPQELADALEAARPDGSLRKYSQALWDFLGIIEPALRGTHDWNAIYNPEASSSKGSWRDEAAKAALQRLKDNGAEDVSLIADDTPAEAPPKPASKPTGIRTQEQTIHAGRTPQELLEMAAPYEKYGPDYDRNIAASAGRLHQDIERNSKSMQLSADELAVRLELYAPNATLAEKPKTAGGAIKPTLPDNLVKGLLSRGHEVAPSGPANAAFRQDVIEALTGKRPPKANAGVNAVEALLHETFKTNPDQTRAGRDDELREKLRALLPSSTKQAAPKRRPRLGRNPNGYDILDFLNENPIALPPADQRTGRGEYDRLEKGDISRYYLQFITSRTDNAIGSATPDVRAQEAYDHVDQNGNPSPLIAEPSADALYDAISSAITGRKQIRAQVQRQDRELKDAEAKTIRFDKDRADGGKPIDMQTLATGDTLVVNGTPLEVTEVRTDEDGYVTGVTLRDGERYGVQSIEATEAVLVDDYIPAERVPADFLPPQFTLEQETPEQIAERQRLEEQRRKLEERQSRPLEGTAGEYGTPDLLDSTAGDMALFNQPPVAKSNIQPDTTTDELPASSRLELDQRGGTVENGSRDSGVQPESRPVGEDGRPLDEAGTRGGDTGSGSNVPANVPAALGGRSGDPVIRGSSAGTENSTAGDSEREGSGNPDESGVAVERRPDITSGETIAVPTGASSVAQGVEVGAGIDAIRRAVPSLTETQAGDVAFAEKRLAEKPGVLLTNGTGTGKTFSGLGVVKRALDAGKQHILILAPTDKIANDWIRTAKNFFGIDDIAQLEDTKADGKGNRVVVTLYANAGQNNALVHRPWDMVVTDEAHHLSQNKDGETTLQLDTVRGLTWHPKFAAQNRTNMVMHKEIARVNEIREIVRRNVRIMNNDDTMDVMVASLRKENEVLENEQFALQRQINDYREGVQRQISQMAERDRPKVLMLSATPFAYHFSLDYAEGYLFNFPEENTRTVGRYNHASPRSRFYMDNFGYRMRYGKLTTPENATATGILERRFAQKLMADGAVSGSSLNVDQDYGRHFVVTPSALGTAIDQVMDAMMKNPRLGVLAGRISIGDFLERRYLLEALKAKEAIDRARKHIALGRKVVIFHDYKKGGSSNPLDIGYIDPGLEVAYYDPETKKGATVKVADAYAELKAMFPEWDEWKKGFNGLLAPLDAFERSGLRYRAFNGDIPKKQRIQNVDDFNKSNSDVDVILVQRASGKEGISLHDIDGTHQRVLIDLGIPGRPTDAIQTEGRIYRHGVVSNAVVEYLTTGTSFERWTFAQTIATRSSTAENLAMGERARSLLQSFASGYMDAEEMEPSKAQGTGGKAKDSSLQNSDPFKDAVALYYTNQKKNSRNKAAEGIDYFATPEPLGFKMVEWAGIRPGEKVLEPSAGHGAIARFFPDSTNRHAVEPSNELAGRLALNATDVQIHETRFEDYHIANKYDVIVMNPPFGTAGKTAMEHVIKATQHLRNGGRIVALIPEGSSMEKRFDAWMESEESEGIYQVAEYGLPAVTFERAGTSVRARVVVLDKTDAPELIGGKSRGRRDFSGDTPAQFFDSLKNATAPERAEVKKAEPLETPEEAPKAPMTRDTIFPVASVAKPNVFAPAETVHAKKGIPLFVAKITKRLSSEEYGKAKNLATKHKGYYSKYDKAGAIPGFQFETAENRDAFISEAMKGTEGGTLSSAPAMPIDRATAIVRNLDKVQAKRALNPKEQADYDAAKRTLAQSTRPATTHVMPDGYELTERGTHILPRAPIRAYHGTPHKFDKFSTEKIGTGEGSQAYGWGLYFAANREVAEQYSVSTITSAPILWDGEPYDGTNPRHVAGAKLRFAKGDRDLAISRSKPEIADIIRNGQEATAREKGNLYTVELLGDPDDFLDWDRPLSEQSEKVKGAFRALWRQLGSNQDPAGQTATPNANSGSSLYRRIAVVDPLMSPKELSTRLASLGIKGIRYLDAGSRAQGDGSRNYVIFDESLVRILEENGRPVATDNSNVLNSAPANSREGPEPLIASAPTPLDAAYMAAVEAGNMDTAQQMVDEAAKTAGYTLGPVYHNSPAANITSFLPFARELLNKEKTTEQVLDWLKEHRAKVANNEKLGYMNFRKGTFTSPTKEGDRSYTSYGPHQYRLFLRVNNPVRLKGRSDTSIDIPGKSMDALMIYNDHGNGWVLDEIAVLDPSQIKSADSVTRDENGNVIPLSKRFNPASDSILYSAPRPDAKAAEIKKVLENMPPIWRDVLKDTWDGKKLDAIAKDRHLSVNAVGNILRMAEGRFRVLMAAQSKTLKPTVRVEGDAVKAADGRPDLAGSGNPLVAAVDQRRARPEEVTHAEMNDLAESLFAADPVAAEKLVVRWMDSGTTVLSTDGMPDSIKDIVNDATARQAAEMLMTAAAKLLVTDKSLNGGDTLQIARLIDLYRNTGTEQARALNMRYDPHATPEERAAMYVSEALLTPPQSMRNDIKRNPANKERILAQWAQKADNIKADLKAAGYDIDATFRALKREKTLAEKAVPTELKMPLARASGKTRKLVRAVLEGHSWKEAAQAAGMSLDFARKAYNAFRDAINKTGQKAAEAQRDALLRSAPAPNDFAAAIGLPEWDETANVDVAPVRTPVTEELKKERKRKKSGGEFSLQNPVAVADALNKISERKSGAFDKLSEFWRASILSGPQTHVVNAVSSSLYGGYEATLKKMGTGALADIARLFGMKPDAASLADLPAMMSATLPAIQEAWGHALRSWRAENRFFDAYARGEQFGDSKFKEESFQPALGGVVGKVMRSISFRAMTAADEFVKSFFTRIEAAAQARQIARAEGLTGKPMADRIAELSVPGSEAWIRALDHAHEVTFQKHIGEGHRIIDQIDGVAKLIERAKSGDFGGLVKGVSHFVFPFVATPLNIFKSGLTLSPMGSLLAVIDAARAYDQKRKGNTEEAARIYNAARALDDLANQIVAWGAMYALASLVKPGDDPDDLPFITGSMEWRTTAKGERELAYRTAPPQSIRIGDKWYSYRRLDPFASALAFSVDAIKSFQNDKPIDEEWAKVGIQVLNNMQDKTFLQGLSDLMNAVRDPERFGTQWAVNLSTGFIPNLIRQPLRSADPYIREKDLPNDMPFFTALGHLIGYGVVPQAAPPKVDVWGNPADKNTGTGGPLTDTLFRLFSPIDQRDGSQPDPLDVALLRYNVSHEQDQFAMAAPRREIQRKIGGQTVKVSLNDDEFNALVTQAGQAARRALGSAYNGQELDEKQVKTIKAVIEKYHEIFIEKAFRARMAQGTATN